MNSWPMLILYLEERQAYGWAKCGEAAGRGDTSSADAWEHYAHTMKGFIEQAQQMIIDQQAASGVVA